MLIECVNCGFYVGSNEKLCPDCGVSDPNAPLLHNPKESDRPLGLKNTVIIAIAVIIGIVVFHHFQNKYDLSDSYGLIALLLILAAVFFIFAVPVITHYSTKRERDSRYASADSATNFRFVQDTILIRNHELKEKLREFKSAAKRGIRLSRRHAKPQTPPERIDILNLIARYDLLSNRIDFARLQNELLPLIEQRNASKKAEDYSETLDEIIWEIELTNLSLAEGYAAETSEVFQTEKRDFLAQIDETEKACEALSNRPNDTQPFENDYRMPSSNDSIHWAKIFDAQTTLRNLGESFNRAEREFRRLEIIRR